MTIGSVNCSPNQVLASDAVTVDARRSDLQERQNPEANTGKTPTTARPEFVLGASAYRRVVATLETESDAAPARSGVHGPDRNTAYAANAATSYTGQRAQRSYQDAGQLNERESISSLFGVDLFA